ncbi:hypothetical protein [Paraburkholderia unamae]|uniref:HTH cro/C1-type domain-containing protein n=1 Tax=Paraburkholderia unamae TaxID=219649 RepID=A0ABX5KLG5_9BURK|nr:hypothetical protein [Paraburkholderia unamae]PVX77195.1 hypothetical protein C7402_115254 [Paraburkholderia unamae]
MKKVLSDNLTTLLESRPDISRLNLSKQIKVADGSLGRIKYGTGNPTIETLEDIARFFKVEAWQLLAPNLGRESHQATEAPVQQQKVRRNLIAVPSARDRPRQLSGGAARNAKIATANFDQIIEKVVEKAVEEAVKKALSIEHERWESERRKAG